jgi:hypothetical protein
MDRIIQKKGENMNNNRIITHTCILIFLLTACAPSETTIQTAIANTLTAAPTLTTIPTQTNTPFPTFTSTPKRTSTPRPTPTSDMGTFSNPLPSGYSAGMQRSVNGVSVSFNFEIKNVIRGQDAWTIIYRANQFNDAPPSGMEAIMVELYVKVISTSGFLTLNNYDLSIATKGRVIGPFAYSPCCLNNAGYTEFDAKLNPGGELTGWIASMVSIDDNAPLLVLDADYNGQGGVYFSLPTQ